MGDSSTTTKQIKRRTMAKEKKEKVVTPAEEVNTEKLDPQVEELVRGFNKLDAENKMLKSRLKEAAEQIKFLSMGEVHKKLEWLWKVITLDGGDDIFGDEFLQQCVNEFVEILTPVPEEKENK